MSNDSGQGVSIVGSRRPSVTVIGTGGSISTIGRHNLDLAEYGDFGRVLEAAELFDRYPEASLDATLDFQQFRAIPSTGIGPSDWLELNLLAHECAMKEPAPAGIVMTHGTATLEETAYFLHLTQCHEVPIVLVGAQRPPSALSSDAGLNLVNAVRVACAPSARGLGVLAVANDEIHTARDVTKTNTYRVHTFRSLSRGPLGVVDPDGVTIYRLPARPHGARTPFDVREVATLPRVEIAYSYAGSDGLAIDAFAEAGAAAVVLAALAPGKPTPGEVDAIRRARERGVVIVNSCRAGEGRVIERERTKELGVVVADDLNPQKARVLAMIALTKTFNLAELQRIFDTY